MGYLKQPVRRGHARRAKRTFVDGGRDVDPRGWTDEFAIERAAADTFLRFAVRGTDGSLAGLFLSSAMIELSADVPESAASVARSVYHWFNRNLPVPRRLPRPAVCWFRADAAECREQLRTLIEVYRLAGHTVCMLATRTPGRVVYRDALQVAAIAMPGGRVTASVW